MALKATIYKATVNVADLDRNQFLDASLTLARHPSETQERMMLRLLAWLKYADERLQFTRGLCADDEPEVKWHTEFGHLNRGDMLTSEQHRCSNEKKKFQRRV